MPEQETKCLCSDCDKFQMTLVPLILFAQLALVSLTVSYALAAALAVGFFAVWTWRVRIKDKIARHEFRPLVTTRPPD